MKKEIKKIFEAVDELYYRHCCWDGPKCDNCTEFDKLRKQYKKSKKKKVKKAEKKVESTYYRPNHGPVCVCDECM